jgi:hypothetical protein
MASGPSVITTARMPATISKLEKIGPVGVMGVRGATTIRGVYGGRVGYGNTVGRIKVTRCWLHRVRVGVRDVRFRASPEELSRIAFSLRSSWPISLISD